MNTVFTLARFTVVEAWRSRWVWMMAACLLISFSLAVFVGELALNERLPLVLSMVAPLARLLAVMLVTLLTVSAVVREFSERSIMLMLAAPISRSTWLLGKGLGFVAISVVSAFVCAAPIWLLSPGLASVVWTVSLALELCLVASGSLLLACVLRQVPIAILAMLGLYAMSRVLGVLLLLAERAPLSTVTSNSASTSFFDTPLEIGFFGFLELILPRLDLFTQTQWLLNDLPSKAVNIGLIQALIYGSLLWAAARIDFGSKDV